MNAKSLLRVVTIFFMCVSLVLQLHLLLLVFYEFHVTGGIGFISGLTYGATLPFSIPSFLMATGLAYMAKIRLPMKWFYLPYFGSHFIIIVLALLFSGKFGA